MKNLFHCWIVPSAVFVGSFYLIMKPFGIIVWALFMLLVVVGSKKYIEKYLSN